MTRVGVELFGPAREAAGARRVEVEVGERATAGDVVDALRERFPELAGLLPRSRVAVGLEYVDLDTPIEPGEEIAVIPPVGGG